MTKTMTYFTKTVSSRGQERRIAISLPYISCLAGDAHYQPPPKPEPIERGPNLSAANIRRALGRAEPPKKFDADELKYQMAMARTFEARSVSGELLEHLRKMQTLSSPRR